MKTSRMRRFKSICVLLSLIVLVIGGGRSPTTVYADTVEHTHIWATKYDDKNHWEYCTVCGEKRNITAHVFTDHWYLGYESCSHQNYSLRTCSCGYSYTYHKPHQNGEYWNYSIPRGWHWKNCKICGTWTASGQCVDVNNKRLTCKNPGTCAVCGITRTSDYHFLVNGKCRDCGKTFFTYTKPKVTYNSDYSGCVVTFSITPVDSQASLTGEYGDFTSGVYKSGTTSIKRLQDGTIEYTRTYAFNPLINSKVSSTVGNNETMVKINGYRTWTESFGISWTVWRDHQAPVQNDVIQKDQASANGWATIKQLTLSGTENLSDIVYLTISDKVTGEKYVTDAAVPVTDGKYSYTCTPSIEGDINGRTYVVTAKDRIGNTSTKEFVTSKTDGSAPQLKNGTSLTYTDWTTSKDISLSFFDFGSGGVKASLDNQTDYKPLTKSGEYYIWNHSFGNQVGTSEHTIYVKDALGNATSYKLTVGNTDSNVYSISYNLNGGVMNGQKTSYTVADSFTLPTPTKTGYTFTGWTGSNGTTPQKTVTVTKGNADNKSYTANWSVNNYYVTFNGNGGSLNVMDGTIAKNNNGTATAKVQYDFNYYYSLGILATKPGYTLKGFYDAPSGGVQVFRVDGTTRCLSVTSKYYNENNIWKYTGNVTFYAQWEPVHYTIKYDANGGTGAMADTSVIYDSGTIVRKNIFIREGYTFSYWYMSRTNNGKIEWFYGKSNASSIEMSYINADSWYEEGKNPPGTEKYKLTDGHTFHCSNTINDCIITAHAHWSYNPVSVKVPQVLTGDHAGTSQFRVKCDGLKAGNIKVTVPNSFSYKQAGKADVTAVITSKSGNNIITPSNKVCVYNITTKNGLTAGCWQGSFNIGLMLTKE